MKYITPEARQLPVIRDVDVLICGGGFDRCFRQLGCKRIAGST